MPRRLRSHLVCGWLLWQLVATVATPVVVWTSAPAQVQVVCQCGHGSGASCPMHKHKTPQGNSECALRSSTPDGVAALLSLLSPVGLTPSPARTNLTHASVPRQVFTPVAIDRSIDPDPPPPRA